MTLPQLRAADTQNPSLGSRRSPRLWRLILTPRIAGPALKVSLVVGITLNLINHSERWWTQHSVNLWQIALNFAVPFCVSVCSAARNEAQRAAGE
jgi:hypothetical protein